MTSKDLFEALKSIEEEKNIPMDYMLSQIEKSMQVACRNYYDGNDNVVFEVNPEKKTIDIRLIKKVVEEVERPGFEVTVEEAQQINKRKRYFVGDEIEIPLNPKQLSRISIATARNTIRQGIRDGEKGQSQLEFRKHLDEIVTAQVENVDPNSGDAQIKINGKLAYLPKKEQVGCENLEAGDNVKIYVTEMNNKNKDRGREGTQIIFTRTHPGFVKRLFENQVPEISDGIVEIKSVSREAGSRTKMAVFSTNKDVDAIGACIGTKGIRVNTVVEELGGEKIDIIEYSEDPVKYISAALSPATVCSVVITDEEYKSCKATVPDGQLSLAIGNKGQNVRLAVKLTGWKIDIHPESGYYGEDDDEDIIENDESVETSEEIVMDDTVMLEDADMVEDTVMLEDEVMADDEAILEDEDIADDEAILEDEDILEDVDVADEEAEIEEK